MGNQRSSPGNHEEPASTGRRMAEAVSRRLSRRRRPTTETTKDPGSDKPSVMNNGHEQSSLAKDEDEKTTLTQNLGTKLQLDDRNSDDAERCLKFGVSLAHLRALPIDPHATFHAAAAYVKAQTVNQTGYRSYARFLLENPATKHLASEQASVFVSYAWGGEFQQTMDALHSYFSSSSSNYLQGEEEVFVWMDFAIVDQHRAAEENVNFEEWARMFRGNLRSAGRAVLVLTPGEKPLAVNRSWCCFEWVTIVDAKIPFGYCIPPKDEEALIQRMHNGMGSADYNSLFAGINVERAQAWKESDQIAILKLMREIGVVKVNDVVMQSLKNWLVEVATKAEARAIAEENKEALVKTWNARGTLHSTLGELDAASPYMWKALTMALEQRMGMGIVAALLSNVASLLQDKGDLKGAEPLFQEAIEMNKKNLGDNHPHVATTINNLALLYKTKGDLDGAEPLYREALAIRRNALGDSHPDIAVSLNNLAGVLFGRGDFAGAEPLYREAIDMQKRLIGDNSPTVATSLNNLASLLQSKGDLATAEPLHREALAIRRKTLGDGSPDVAQTLNNLGYLLLDTGRKEEARVMGLEAHAIALKALGPDHAYTINYRFWLNLT